MSTPPDESGTGPRPSNRGMAVTSVVLGVVSVPMFLCLGTGAFVGGLAVFAGTRALREDSSRRIAIAGIVLGAVGVVLGLGFLALLVFAPDQTTVRTR
jgi:hypothetical protein